MALNPNALCSLDDLKGYLGVSSAEHDSALEALINAVSEGIESYCRRRLLARDYSCRSSDEAYDPANAIVDGTGYETVMLPQFPVLDMSALLVDGEEIAQAVGIGYGWLLDPAPGLLYFQGGLFPRGRRNVGLIYRAGFEVAPADLAQAAVEWAAAKVLDSHLAGNLGGGRLGVRSEALPQQMGTTTYSEAEMPPSVRLVLDRYRRKELL